MKTIRHTFIIYICALSAASALSAEPANGKTAPKPFRVRTVPIANYSAQDGVIDSLRYALCRVKDENLNFWQREYPLNAGFADRADILEVQTIPDRPELHCKLWIQDEKAPLVFVLPGLGGHYQSRGPNALAQLYFNAGYSVALLSSTMNWEFYMAASRSKAPGLPSTDAIDVREALRTALGKIKKQYPGKVASIYLTGFSLGALHTILIAEIESKSDKKIGFAGYLAVHPPIDAFNAMKTIDTLMADGKNDASDKKTIMNVEKGGGAYLSLLARGLPHNAKVRATKKQAGLVIAIAYRMALRELLVVVKKSGNDMGLIKHEYGFTKNNLYKEINAISFGEYADKFVVTASAERLKRRFPISTLQKLSNLERMTEFLSSPKAANIHLITAADDFLLTQKNIEWIAKTFENRCVIFEHGGHMGELYTPEAKKALLENLKATSR